MCFGVLTLILISDFSPFEEVGCEDIKFIMKVQVQLNRFPKASLTEEKKFALSANVPLSGNA